jgi:hypothetical protein
MNSAKNLLDYARTQGYKVAVTCASEGDVLQKSTTSWPKIKEAIESTGYVHMVVRDTIKKISIAVALVIDHEDTEEWVSDYGVNDFMTGWEKQFYARN